MYQTLYEKYNGKICHKMASTTPCEFSLSEGKYYFWTERNGIKTSSDNEMTDVSGNTTVNIAEIK